MALPGEPMRFVVMAVMLCNRRAYTRVPMRSLVICIVDSRTIRGVSWNLGEGGMQVDVSSLKSNETVQLSFRLPVSGLAVDAEGVGIWGDENRHGIQFIRVGTQSRQSIHPYVTERSGTGV